MENKWHFRTPVDPPKVTVTPSGEKIENVWEMRLNEKGSEEFYIAGKTNVYEKIQAHLEETKIENILARCIDTGDYSALEKIQGSYLDTTMAPKNIFEAHQKIKEAENQFMQLPLEIREKYDNSFNKYLADFGSENWVKVMGFEEKKEPVQEEKKEPVQEEKEETKE